MLIVDSQVHIWGADTPDRPWPPGGARRAQKPYPVTKDMLLAEMDTAGVSRVVIVPPSWEGDRNDLALQAARLHPKRFAVMGRLAIERPESRALVAHWKEQPGMLGMRFTFHTDLQRPRLTDGTADWLWPAAERAGIPLMVLVPGSLDALRGIAERHPGSSSRSTTSGSTALRRIAIRSTTCRRSARSQSFRMSPSRRRACRPCRPSTTRSATSIRTSVGSSTRSALGGRSGARISRGCRARIGSASTCSRKSCPGSRAPTSSG